jgi:hypothetical protein
MKKITVLVILSLIVSISFSFSTSEYRKMVRGDESIAGERYDFSGIVIQWWTVEGYDTKLDMYMIATEWNSYSNDKYVILAVTANCPSDDFIEDDKVHFKNTYYNELYTYETVSGGTNSLPFFVADKDAKGMTYLEYLYD